MTSFKVMESFKTFIEREIKEIRLSNKYNEGRRPKVILGYLDPLDDESDEKEDFPYVMIRYVSGETGNTESTISLKLIFGVYSEDASGWVDVLHMIEVIKTVILKKRIFDFYTLDSPIKTSIPEEQPYPYFFGFMDLQFNIPQIEMEGVVSAWLPE